MRYLLIFAGMATLFFAFISLRTVWEGYRTSNRRYLREPAWKESFKSHRRFGKLIWVSIGLLVLAITPVEMELRAQGTGAYSGLLILHLILVGLFLCNLLLLHVYTGLTDRVQHGVYGVLYIALTGGIGITGATLYLHLLYNL